MWFDSVDSTHAVALRLMEQVDKEDLTLRPTLFVAATQSSGVGRGQREWVSPPGGLYLNWVAAGFSDEVVSYLPMLSAAATLLVLTEIGVGSATIKWPNDILVNGHKLAGLLVHARRSETALVTVGLGVNLRPVGPMSPEAIHQPTSLDEILGEDTSLETVVTVVRGFIRRLVGFLEDPAPALALWREKLGHRDGDPLKVRLATGEELTGLFAGLTADGFLRLQQDDGVRVVTGGDIVEGDSLPV